MFSFTEVIYIYTVNLLIHQTMILKYQLCFYKTNTCVLLFFLLNMMCWLWLTTERAVMHVIGRPADHMSWICVNSFDNTDQGFLDKIASTMNMLYGFKHNYLWVMDMSTIKVQREV